MRVWCCRWCGGEFLLGIGESVLFIFSRRIRKDIRVLGLLRLLVFLRGWIREDGKLNLCKRNWLDLKKIMICLSFYECSTTALRFGGEKNLGILRLEMKGVPSRQLPFLFGLWWKSPGTWLFHRTSLRWGIRGPTCLLPCCNLWSLGEVLVLCTSEWRCSRSWRWVPVLVVLRWTWLVQSRIVWLSSFNWLVYWKVWYRDVWGWSGGDRRVLWRFDRWYIVYVVPVVEWICRLLVWGCADRYPYVRRRDRCLYRCVLWLLFRDLLYWGVLAVGETLSSGMFVVRLLNLKMRRSFFLKLLLS